MVMHDGTVVIRHLEGIDDFLWIFLKISQHPRSDIVLQNVHVFVSVCARVFMEKAQGMHLSIQTVFE